MANLFKQVAADRVAARKAEAEAKVQAKTQKVGLKLVEVEQPAEEKTLETWMARRASVIRK